MHAAANGGLGIDFSRAAGVDEFELHFWRRKSVRETILETPVVCTQDFTSVYIYTSHDPRRHIGCGSDCVLGMRCVAMRESIRLPPRQ